jgi:hypothetical protein
MKENIVFSDADFYNFSKACNLKIDYNYAKSNFFNNNMPKVLKNSLLGPCYIHSVDVNPKNVKYNLSKIINDLQLSRQNLTPSEKLQKVIDYITLLG